MYPSHQVLSKAKLFEVNTTLRAQGVKPAMAGDIWSDHGVSLLGLCEYYMSDEWTIEELVLAATRCMMIGYRAGSPISPGRSSAPTRLPPSSTHASSRLDGLDLIQQGDKAWALRDHRARSGLGMHSAYMYTPTHSTVHTRVCRTGHLVCIM